MAIAQRKKERAYVGVDLGTGSIKLVEIHPINNRPTLVTYAFSESPYGNIVSDVAEYKNKELAPVLKEVAAKAKIHTKNVVAALPTFAVFSSVITLPKMANKQLQQAVENEAKKVMPLDVKEMLIDWSIISTEATTAQTTAEARKQIKTKQQENVRILLTAVSQKLVNKYLEVFKLAGLNLVSLETEVFALTRALVGKDQASIMLVDMGASSSSVSIVEKGVPVLNRTIGYGGKNLTKFLSSKMTLPLEKAETIKKDLRPGNEKVATVLYSQLQPVIDEIKYSYKLYTGRNVHKIEKVILTGGGAGLHGLSDHLSDELGVTVQVGDPWARVDTNPDLRPLLDKIGPRFGVAVGMALQQFDQ